MAVIAVSLHDDLLCGGCRQNLRGVPDGRCPECGRAFRRDALLSGRVPWEQRREIGRVRAYLATLRLVLVRPAALARYADAPVDDRAARAFCRWTVFWAALVSAGVAAGVLQKIGGAMSMSAASDHWPPFWGEPWSRSVWQVLGVLMVVANNPVFFGTSALAAALWLPAVMQTSARFFDDRRLGDGGRRARAAALGQYAAAPFAWVLCIALLASLTFTPQAQVIRGGYPDLQPRWEMTALALLLLGIPVFWFASSARLLRRVTGCSRRRQALYVAAMPLLAGLWAVVIFGGLHALVVQATMLWAAR